MLFMDNPLMFPLQDSKGLLLFQLTSVNLPVDVLCDGEEDLQSVRRRSSNMELQGVAMYGLA